MAKGQIITGLDAGSSCIKVLVVLKNPKEETFEIVSQISAPSAGIRKGVIINTDEAAKSILRAVQEAQEASRQKIKNVYCSLGGSHIFVISGQGRVAVSRADETVSQEDVERALSAARAPALPPNKQIIETVSKYFVLDGEGGIKDVEGMKGIRLEAHALLLGGFTPYIKNLTQAVLCANLGFEDLFLNPMASSKAVLTPRQKELGVALVDIGAGTTSVAVFEEGNLLHLSVIPVGSSHITNDIAIGLKTDIEIAERIKLEFGSALLQSGGKREIIDLSENVGEDLTFTKRELSEIIESRLSEIFDLVNKELKSVFKERLLPAGIVLTGGGSKLPKIKDFARNELKLPVHLGTPSGFTESFEDPSFAVCAGVVLLSQELPSEKKPSFPNNSGFGSKIKKIIEKLFVP